MSNDTSTNDDGTPRSSNLSPSITLSPIWAPPKAPLPPHRLAKLANALGVSTPMPAVHRNTPFMSRLMLDSPSQPDTLRRSPTPSTVASMASYTPSISKYLLHVIPPPHLPHESEEDPYVTPPPATASGYHTQFRRGTLVPVYSTLQAQLAAIAKEYALPNTTGLILYLVSSAKVPLQGSSPSLELPDDEEDPGPRLSEDIWKHLWTRVTKAEQRDDYLPSHSRSPTPNIFSLSNGARSTPFLPQDGQPLRPFLSIMGSDSVHPQPLLPAFTSSPSTSSTASDLRSQSKSAPPSSVSQSDPDTPDTSTGSHSFARDRIPKDSLDLPGLTSPSVIPILAKVEFDIDRRKAAWYDPWLRSRRMNHAKRTESRTGRKFSVNEDEDNPREKHRPVSLVTGTKEASSLMMSKGISLFEHQPLPELGDADELPGEIGVKGDEPSARVGTSDGDHPADLQHPGQEEDEVQESLGETGTKGDELSTRVGTSDGDHSADLQHLGQEEDEVRDLLDQMSRPQQPVINPPLSLPDKRSSSPTGSKKHVPPRLVIMPNAESKDLVIPTAEASPMPSSAGSTHLAYLYGDSPVGSGERAEADDDDFVSYTRLRSPAENEKREGAVFDDLDLGLDPTVDFDDPNDRRRSQFLMKAQLDEIERTMVQLSPRIMDIDLPQGQNNNNNISGMSSPSNSHSLSPGKWNGSHPPRSRRQSEAKDRNGESKGQAVWPAVPFSTVNNASASPPPPRPDGPPSPPRLAVNGITTSAPTSFVAQPRSSASETSTETQMRKLALEEEQGYLGFSSPTIPTDSPIIPLSPDPFGRFSSTPDGRSSTYWEADDPAQSSSFTLSSVAKDTHSRTHSTSSAAASRFSVDSIAEEGTIPNKPNNRSTLITVNTIKRLWRKSNRALPAPDLPPPSPSPHPAGGRTAMQMPQRPERPLPEELASAPSTPTMSKFPPQLAPPQRPERPLPEELASAPSTPTMSKFPPQLAPPRPSKELPPPPSQQLAVPQSPSTPPLPVHPSPQELLVQPPPQQLPVHRQTHYPPIPQPPIQPHQLSVPKIGIPQPPHLPGAFNGRPGAPIIAARMRHNEGNGSVDRLQFDQESPYPIHRMPLSPQLTPTQPSPNTRFAELPLASVPPSPVPPANPPPTPEKEKLSARKSILKGWKSPTSSTSQSSSIAETRSSIDKSSMEGSSTERSSTERPSSAGRSRRPSHGVLPFGSSRSSVVSPPPDIPPSPQIPQQYINPLRNEHRQSVKFKLASESVDLSNSNHHNHPITDARSPSPQRSIRSSISSRPSFDTSQFEIVSPRMNSTLSYPYSELN